MNWVRKGLAGCLFAISIFVPVTFAHAAFHLFKIDEVYSNASGTVQYIELDASVNSTQQFVVGQTLKSNSHTYTFPANLPGDTANKKFILATPGYFALTGVPAADYNLGVNNFFSVAGDTINFATNTNTLTFTSGQLPINNLNSLNRAYSALPTTFTVGTNSPTNFANTTGSVLKAGDANFDFHVNTGDIKSLMGALSFPDSYADTNSITTSQIASVADVNKDGSVSNADLQKLLNNLKSGGGSTSPVPEPTSMLLATLFSGLLWRSRKQFRIG